MNKTGLRVASLEADSAQAAVIRAIVTGAGHECVTFAEGRRMLLTLRKVKFDLLLEWRTPLVTGRDILGWVRAHLDPRVPVNVTSHGREEDVVGALQAGADDYMVMRELGARIEALLRRVYPDMRQPEEGNCHGLDSYSIPSRAMSPAVARRLR